MRRCYVVVYDTCSVPVFHTRVQGQIRGFMVLPKQYIRSNKKKSMFTVILIQLSDS
jgi:hypothetical protein